MNSDKRNQILKKEKEELIRKYKKMGWVKLAEEEQEKLDRWLNEISMSDGKGGRIYY